MLTDSDHRPPMGNHQPPGEHYQRAKTTAPNYRLTDTTHYPVNDTNRPGTLTALNHSITTNRNEAHVNPAR